MPQISFEKSLDGQDLSALIGRSDLCERLRSQAGIALTGPRFCANYLRLFYAAFNFSSFKVDDIIASCETTAQSHHLYTITGRTDGYAIDFTHIMNIKNMSSTEYYSIAGFKKTTARVLEVKDYQ